MNTKEFLARYNGNTRKSYAAYLSYLAGRNLETMTVSELVDFFESKGWSQNSRRLCLVIVCSYLKFLGFKEHPLFDFKIKRHPSRRLRAITPEQVEALLDICDPATPIGLRNSALIRILWDSWIRANEVCSLLESDLDLKRCELTVVQKGGALHTTSYSPETAKWLRRWLKLKHRIKHTKDCPYAFVGIGGLKPGTKLTRHGLRAIFRKLGIRVGFAVAPHDFRRGGATHFANSGGNDRLGMDHGGWRDHSTYAKYTKEISRAAFKRQAWGVESHG